MGLIARATQIGEGFGWPDPVSRSVIGMLVARTDRELAEAPDGSAALFAEEMRGLPVAMNTADANAQHYELPERFFGLVLGPRRKYSSCLFPHADTSLKEAEEYALEQTAKHAALEDGQTVLELGCGWGSLSLWMAEHFPGSRIVSISNSHSQRAYIEAEAARRGLSNLSVQTADMNDFATEKQFDRVVSVEMFEHMSNWQLLLSRVKGWLAPDGRAFIHVFSHTGAPYRFDRDNPGDWIAQHFFTGGIMPSHRLMFEFPESFSVEQDWRWSGEHYRRTADAWLANFDANASEIDLLMRAVYGADARLWTRRWRLFFLATSGLFGHDSGRAWGVSNYLLRPSAA